MSIYYANEIDEYLAHAGVKGMKKGQHVMARDPDYLRRIRLGKYVSRGINKTGWTPGKIQRNTVVTDKEKILNKLRLSNKTGVSIAKAANKQQFLKSVKGGKLGYGARRIGRKAARKLRKAIDNLIVTEENYSGLNGKKYLTKRTGLIESVKNAKNAASKRIKAKEKELQGKKFKKRYAGIKYLKEQEYNTNKSPNRPTKRAEDYRLKRKSGSVRKRGKALNLGGPVGDSRGRRKRK